MPVGEDVWDKEQCFRFGKGRAFLRRISCPTVLVKATDGMKVPSSYLEREGEVSGIEILSFEGGHHLHLDYPERVQKVLRVLKK